MSFNQYSDIYNNNSNNNSKRHLIYSEDGVIEVFLEVTLE